MIAVIAQLFLAIVANSSMLQAQFVAEAYGVYEGIQCLPIINKHVLSGNNNPRAIELVLGG